MKKVLFKNYSAPIALIASLSVTIEAVIAFPTYYKLVIPLIIQTILIIGVCLTCLFFSGIKVSSNEIQIGQIYEIPQFEEELKIKKGVYAFPFKDLVYVGCVQRLDAKPFTFSLIIAKKNGKKYEIEYTCYGYKRLRKTLKRYFENYKKNHPEEFTNFDLSQMDFELRKINMLF